jgi:heme-degrading monooxygenase HmoA
MSLDPVWHYAVIWEFRVKPEFQAQFEQVYGPNGEWARFFRSDAAYVKTELIRDSITPGRYVTIDFWRSGEDYESFRRQHADEYHEIDQHCDSITETERALGTFERVPLS